MFKNAKMFDGDISRWDVSSVTEMEDMFSGAISFARALCGAAWVNSKANKADMFVGSSGSISGVTCPTTGNTAGQKRAFSPTSKSELKNAIETCQSTCED